MKPIHPYQSTLDLRRIEEGLTLTELARRSHIRLTTLSLIVNGHTRPTRRTRHMLATALKTTPAAIFVDEGGAK